MKALPKKIYFDNVTGLRSTEEYVPAVSELVMSGATLSSSDDAKLMSAELVRRYNAFDDLLLAASDSALMITLLKTKFGEKGVTFPLAYQQREDFVTSLLKEFSNEA
jgi:hypothetical protein